MESVNTLEEVRSVLEDLGAELIHVDHENGILIVEQNGVPVTVALTDEEAQRLRFSVDVSRLDDFSDEDALSEVQFKLLDLNTEIDPVATAIDSVDPENIMIQARATLLTGSLQVEEVTSQFNGLMSSLSFISEAVKS